MNACQRIPAFHKISYNLFVSDSTKNVDISVWFLEKIFGSHDWIFFSEYEYITHTCE